MRVARYYNNAEVYFIKNVLLTGNLVHPPRRLALPLYLYLLYLARWPPCGHGTAGQEWEQKETEKEKDRKELLWIYIGKRTAHFRPVNL